MILNKTKQRIISGKESYCRNIFSQGWGLMFSLRKKNLVMAFEEEKRVRLHSWFVFYPIDVLVLDKDKKIIEIKKNFKPFGFWSSKREGKYVVELGKDYKIKGENKRYNLGDKLKLGLG